jgi:hypothetical protein
MVSLYAIGAHITAVNFPATIPIHNDSLCTLWMMITVLKKNPDSGSY